LHSCGAFVDFRLPLCILLHSTTSHEFTRSCMCLLTSCRSSCRVTTTTPPALPYFRHSPHFSSSPSYFYSPNSPLFPK
jgi:hypothetical protein